MKKLILFTLAIIFIGHYANAQAAVERCSHAGIAYIDISVGATCPDFSGGDAGIQSTWSHFHKGDNSDSYHIKPDNEHFNEEDTGHCLITKDYVEGPPRQIQ